PCYRAVSYHIQTDSVNPQCYRTGTFANARNEKLAVQAQRRHRRIVASPQFANCGLGDDSLVLPIVFIALFKSFPRQSDYTDAPLGAGWEEVST
nr:hypothetical protein [Schwartzia sp. (in: firmicutes)]